MKLIDVFNMMAEGKIKKGTELVVITPSGEEYRYEYAINIHDGYWSFVDDYDRGIGYRLDTTANMLQYEVKLIEQKEKKYLIKVSVRGLIESFEYLNYSKEKGGVVLSTEINNYDYKTHFTQEEIQSIQPVSEFLKDIENKYELIEVEE